MLMSYSASSNVNSLSYFYTLSYPGITQYAGLNLVSSLPIDALIINNAPDFCLAKIVYLDHLVVGEEVNYEIVMLGPGKHFLHCGDRVVKHASAYRLWADVYEEDEALF